MPYIDIETMIPNTTMRKFVNDNNVEMFYEIKPNYDDGYVLHNRSRDWEDEDLDTGVVTYYRGYSRATSTVPINYDFDNTTEIDGYTAYGNKEIFARPISDIDGETNIIFVDPSNDHEVM